MEQEKNKAVKFESKLYVVTTTDTVKSLTKDKAYKILSRFDTDLVGSGHCIVVNNDEQNIQGYDHTHFK